MIRIASFNVENLDDRPGHDPELADRIRVLRPQLLRTRADILCLQEVNGQADGSGRRRLKALDGLLRGTPFEDFHRVASMRKSRGGVRDRHNLVILSRFPVVERHQIRHDLVPPPLYRPVTADPRPEAAEAVEWDRPFLHAALDVGGGKILHVVNVHLRAPRAAFVPGRKADRRTWKSVPAWAEGFFLAALKRAGQAFEVRLCIDRVFDDDEDALIVAAGDFNADEGETPVRTIRGDEEDLGNPSLSPRVLVSLERSVDETRRYSVIHGGRPRMLDHLLASRGLMAHYVGAEIHNEGVGDELSSPAVLKGSPESYHAPVVAEFSLP